MSAESERLEQLLKTFSANQLRFVAARSHFPSDKETAESLDIAYLTVRSWPNKQDINEAIKLMAHDGVIAATEILRRNLPKAALELADELEHKNVNVRHTAAVEILDRTMGKSVQPVELGGEVQYVVFGNIEDVSSDDADPA